MASWVDFAAARPDLAEAGRDLLYQHGVGLAYLASVRRDGGPRVHPMCPLLDSEGLFAFIVPSPKQADLLRDGRYSMHSFPRADNEDAFYLTGAARLVEDPVARSRLSELFVSERKASASRYRRNTSCYSDSRSPRACSPAPPVMPTLTRLIPSGTRRTQSETDWTSGSR